MAYGRDTHNPADPPSAADATAAAAAAADCDIRPLRQATELLAPAGDGEAMRAAIANGADAVYFGLPAFNARQRAANFTLETLDETIDLLHRHRVRGYVAFNTLIMPDELPLAADYVRRIADSGADAVIVQDVGLARFVREMVPTLPLHASTQMTLAEPGAMELARRELGLSRVIVPRELSLDEVRQIRRSSDVELEVFVHGALCISYSGQCLASQWLFSRSANRGACAQPCRLPYSLEIDGVPQPDEVRYPLSPYDLAAYGLVRELVRAGVSALKIEGRLKSPEYVAAVVQVYRAALDAALKDEDFNPDAKQRAALAATFSRGFTPGYLAGSPPEAIVGGQRSAAQGVPLGTVTGRQGDRLLVELADIDGFAVEVAPGDGLAIGGDEPDETAAGGRVYAVEPMSASADRGESGRQKRVALSFSKHDAALLQAPVGAVVWRTDDPQLGRELRKSYARLDIRRSRELNLTVRAVAGQPLQLQAVSEDGLAAHVVSDQPLEVARKHAATVDLLAEQLGRLGDTGYTLGRVSLIADGDEPAEAVPVMIPKSLLNDLRRQLVGALDESRRGRDRHPLADPQALSRLLQEARGAARQEATGEIWLHVLLRSPAQVEGLLAWQQAQGQSAAGAPDASRRPLQLSAIVDALPPERGAMLRRLKSADVAAALATPRIMKIGEQEAVRCLLRSASAGLLVRNMGAIAALAEGVATAQVTTAADSPPQARMVGDFSLNVANPLAAHWLLAGQGLDRLTPAAELTPEDLLQLAQAIGPQRLEIIIHRHMPLMHMAHCLLAASAGRTDELAAPRKNRCRAACRSQRVALVDRMGERLPVTCDEHHHNTIHAPLATSRADSIESLGQMGIEHYRVELLGESAEMTQRLVGLYAAWLQVGRVEPNYLQRLAQLGIRIRG